MPEITFDDFAKVDIRVGRIVQVDDFPQARKPAWKLRIDFGPLGVKTSSAQLTQRYGKDDLMGTLVLAVVNFPPRQIGQRDCLWSLYLAAIGLGWCNRRSLVVRTDRTAGNDSAGEEQSYQLRLHSQCATPVTAGLVSRKTGCFSLRWASLSTT